MSVCSTLCTSRATWTGRLYLQSHGCAIEPRWNPPLHCCVSCGITTDGKPRDWERACIRGVCVPEGDMKTVTSGQLMVPYSSLIAIELDSRVELHA